MLSKQVLLIGLLAFMVNRLTAQPLTPGDYGLKEFTLQDHNLGQIRFYVDTSNLHKKQPLFFEVNGSGGLPLCLYIKGKGFGAVSNTFNSNLKEAVKNNFHYIILGKPGTHFCDSISTDNDEKHYDANQVVSTYSYSKEYTSRLSLNWRINATRKVITYMIQHGYWDHTDIVAYGYSEGGQVVPALAVADKRVTRLIAVAGSGLNQLYDPILAWRIQANTGKLTQQQAQDSIDVYLRQVTDIYRHPENTTKQYSGHTYKRWASFGQHPPFENLRKLKIPIYIIAATADNNSLIYGLDYVQLDFIRLGKKNITYDVCVGCDHYLNNTDNNKPASPTEYISKIIRWLRH